MCPNTEFITLTGNPDGPAIDLPAVAFDPRELGLPETIDQAIGVQLTLRHRFRRITTREVMLLHGPAGWGEFCPFPEYGPPATAHWLACALEAAIEGWPEPIREAIPINATVPAVGPEQAKQIVQSTNAHSVKVKVADPGQTIEDDIDRLRAVRQALGDDGLIRMDANAAWGVEEAIHRITVYNDAARPAGASASTPGLEYVEQPCKTLGELVRVRATTGVRIAADESIRLAEDPFGLPKLHEAADVMVVKAAPLGGVRRALEIIATYQLPVVVSSALESAVGMRAGVALAACVPELGGACGLGTGQLFIQDLDWPITSPFNVTTRPPCPGSLRNAGRVEGLTRLAHQMCTLTR